ncbi:MAG TPA: bifunctional pyr operon transcriptional regulator/uracil phosphoribosyltransferase PyrR [Gammaproteobacteria bacterium]
MTATPDYDIETLLDEMATELQAQLATSGRDNPCMIGIHTGGVWVAEALHRRLGLSCPLGTLDISFYRDDFSRVGMHPQVRPSSLPFTIEEQHIILVDDVLQSGRTIRAALNEIFDYGRPASVMLAVLVERSGHELPIAADVAGIHMELDDDEQVKLQGPAPLTLTLQRQHVYQ